MSVLKPPPKQNRNATIQVRVEEEIDFKLRRYAEFIDCTPAYVVSESLKLLFSKDREFREWLRHNENKPTVSSEEKQATPRTVGSKIGTRTMFDTPTHTDNK